MIQPPMRILFVLESFPALSETFVLNQITGLIDRGHDVSILAGPPLDNTPLHPEIEQYRLMERVTHWPHVPDSLVSRFTKALRSASRARPRRALGLLRTMNPCRFGQTGLLLRPFYLAAAVSDSAPTYDAIICHYGKIGRWCEIARATGNVRGPIITFFHAYDITRYVAQHGRRVYRRLFRHGDLFLAISDVGRKTLLSLGAPSQQTRIHHMGVDLGRFTFEPPDAQNSTAKGELRVLSVARLTEKKGLSYGIEAVARLIKQGQPVRYRIIGDGELRKALELQIRQHSLSEHVELVGWQEATAVRQAMRDADVLLAPSVTAADTGQEGIPVVLMEAMALGLPVLSTYHAGIGELIENEVSGLLVCERDVPAITDRLDRMHRNPHERAAWAQAARRVIETQFEIGTLNDRLVDLCRELSPHTPPLSSAT